MKGGQGIDELVWISSKDLDLARMQVEEWEVYKKISFIMVFI